MSQEELIKIAFKKWQQIDQQESWPEIICDTDSINYVASKDTVKLEALVNCHHTYLYKMHADISPITRSKWDIFDGFFGLGVLTSINVISEIVDKSIYTVEFRVAPVYANYQVRFFKGLFYKRSDEMIIFVSDTSSKDAPKNCVRAYLNYFVLFRKAAENMTFVSMVVHSYNFNSFGPFPFQYRQFLNRFLNMVDICAKKSVYNLIYNLWQCTACNRWNKPELLECNTCKNKR